MGLFGILVLMLCDTTDDLSDRQRHCPLNLTCHRRRRQHRLDSFRNFRVLIGLLLAMECEADQFGGSRLFSQNGQLGLLIPVEKRE